MSYTALYRKFRPTVFEDVRGQEHIVTTLKNQVITGRVGHAYLFIGTRGTGKTTVAKIMAKTVNCQNPKEGNPCGECPSCQAITAGNSMNVIEIDAASNNGVDSIREIIEEVSYPPVDAKYKVYIIDEVHMLSGGAFNALLKTLEEPPAYVIFILATTEMHKIPVTILSRCQRYDFKRISIDTIAERMRELMMIEETPVEERALKYVAKAADGSMRDALSLLDQCIAFHYGKELTYDMVLDVLGATDTEVFSMLLRTIVQDDILGCIEQLEQITMQGRELGQFVTDFTWYLRNLMLIKCSDGEGSEDILDVSTEHLKRLMEEANMLELTQIFRYIEVFSELSNRLRYATQKRILIEMALIRLCRPQMDRDDDSVMERIRTLEKKVEEGVTVHTVASEDVKRVNVQRFERPNAPKVLPKAVPEDIQKIVREWPTIVGMTEHLTRSLLNNAKLSLGAEGQLLLCFDEMMIVSQLKQENRIKEIEQLLADYAGKEINVEIREYDKSQEFGDTYADLRKLINMEIETE
ncbi:MAG: DNA polymerase III subunit gamma/tau [Lachnospiraceae bacterium]|nr:DNA polymerase III subunit gamma/tau [Lachnospiraceae bacterium]